MANKTKSSFVNMVGVLFGVTLVASAAVGYIYTLTKDPINAAKQQKQTAAISEVIAPIVPDNNPSNDMWKAAVNGETDSVECYPAKQNGEVVATIVKTYSKNGFGGRISIMVGFAKDGSILGYNVLEHKETPGLGSHMTEWFQKEGVGNVIGKNPSKGIMKVKKDGGDVDAISAATISSRAFLDAVNRASAAISGVDSYSGATSQNKDDNKPAQESTETTETTEQSKC